jgi:tetratricopeptide (TPR) repeat protein
LRRLSVFAGGFTLEAAEEVCAGDGISESDVLHLLTQLIDKSLVQMEDAGNTMRYRLLETVRQYSLDRLLTCDDSQVWPRRHRDWYLGLAGRAEPALQGPDQRIWLDRLETEHDNLRAALRWSEECGEPHVALQLAAALGRFWTVRGHFSVGRHFLEGALARERGSPRPLRAKAFNAAGGLAHDQGDYETARRSYEQSLAIRRELDDRNGIAQSLNSLGSLARVQGEYTRAVALHEESLALFRQLEDKAGIASAQNSLGIVARYQGNYERAVALHEESLAILRELGDTQGIAFSLNGLGNVARDRGDYIAARLFLEESLAIRRELGERQGIAASLNNLGVVVQYQGDYDRAAALYAESLAIKRELGDKKGMANSLGNLGNVAYDQGDYALATVRYRESLALCQDMRDKVGIAESLINLGNVVQYQRDYEQAIALYRESLALLREMGNKPSIAACVEGLARAQCERGRPERAAKLFGAAEGLREAIGAPVPPAKRAEYEDHVAVVRAQLDPMTFAGAWATGRAMTMEQTLESALTEEQQ